MSLSLERVSYRYAGAPASSLRDVSLEVGAGQVVGVCGPNAGGKSTLCLVAVGLAPITIGGTLEGTVTVDGLTTAGATQHELAQRVGILFQEPLTQLSDSAPSVWEEVAFGPRNLSLPVDEVVARTWTALESLGIDRLAERDPGRLSGGEAQLVALASVLALRPNYLVLDEPTSQLDPEGTRLVGDALARAAATTGAGILLVEHKTDLLARLATELVIIDGGELVRQGDTVAMLALPELDALGVSPPEPVRLRRAAEAAGASWDAAWS